MQKSLFRILFIIIVGLVVTTTAKPACSTTDINAAGSKALIERSISGVCYSDLNKNGRIDKNESGVPGIEVTLKKVFLFVVIRDVETVTTGSDGSFNFSNLSRGIYIIESTVSEDLGLTTRNPFLLSLGIFRSEKSIDFGIDGYQSPDTPPPPQPGPADLNQIIATFSAQPPVISEGGTSTLSWTIKNADTIKINNGIGTVEAMGEIVVSPGQTTLFTLTASNDKKSVSKIVSIVVKPATSPAANVSPPAGGTGPGISLPPLPTTGSISGKIVNANDEPLNNISVYAYDEDEQIIAQAATDVIGDYILDELDPGSYRLLFMPSAEHDNSYIHQWYGNATAHADATSLKIAAGDVRSDINAILNSGGNITGMVIDAKSAPVADILIKVTLLINDTHKPLDDFCAFASTDETGNYKTTGLPEGDYTVAFIDTKIESLPDYSFQYYNDKIIFHERDLVSVSVGEVTHDIDAQLDNG
ncbi:MAG: hypothetical protein GY850_06680, partial [bacterium]|nr:hypothetical protein [bacterium]